MRWNDGGISHRAFLRVHGGEPLAWLPDELWRRSPAEHGYIIEITKGRSSGATLSSAFEVKGRAASHVT